MNTFDPPLPGEAPHGDRVATRARGIVVVGDAFSRGFELFKTHYGVYLAVSLVQLTISLGITFTVGLIPIVGPLVNLIIAGPLIGGVMYVAIMGTRGPVEVGQMFVGFQRFGAMVGVYLLNFVIGLATLLPCLVMIVVVAVAAAAADVGALAPFLVIPVALICMVPALWVGSRLFFAQVLCLDRGIGVIDAFRESWAITQGQAVRLILLYICVIVVMLLTMLAFILPIIFVGMPLSLGIFAAAYETLAGTPDDYEAVFE